ncbi:MAG TPA: TIGR01777 family oxidoreductase [Jatrophihabitans sp.]|nr:TIGR01777 family oxidoreductase [Jatrophihabitans sp.]
MKVLIAGASGFLGHALREELIAHRHLVHTLVRRPARSANEIEWHPEHADLDPDRLRGFGAVIGLSGVGIGDKRWSASYRKELLDSRVQPTTVLAKALAWLPQTQRPNIFINASAIGYYGERGDEVLVETDGPGPGYLPELVVQWEGATQPAVDAGVRVVTLRTGLVLAASGGMLGRMVPLFRFGLGGKLGSGRQWQSWISLADEVAAIRFLLDDNSVSGPVNLTGPEPVRNSELTVQLGRVLHRPALFPAPALALRAVLGEFANEGVLVSQRVVPQKLQQAGYEFQHPDLNSALEWAVRH